MREPPRMNAVDPVAGALFDAARAYRAPTEVRQRLLAAFSLPPSPPLAEPASPALAPAMAAAAKALVGLAAITALGGAGVVTYRATHRAHDTTLTETARDRPPAPARAHGAFGVLAPAPPPEPIAVPPLPDVTGVPAVAATAGGDERPAVAITAARAGTTDPVPVAAARAATRADRVTARPGARAGARRDLARAGAKLARAPARSPADTLPAAPEPSAVAAAASVPVVSPPPGAAGVAAPARLSDEIDLLDRAEAAVRRGDFRGALARLGEHYRRFPAGTLTQEAEVLRIAALLGAGRRAEGEARARRFLGLHSDGVLAAKVRSMLAKHGDGAGDNARPAAEDP